MSGVYWGLTALHLLRRPDALPREELLDFVVSCQHETGGFGAAPGHDAHMLSTLSAVQILVTVDGLSEYESRVPDAKMRIGRYVAGLQQPDGTFAGDEWGETDTRFICCALIALSLLHLLHVSPPLIDVDAAMGHVKACHNFDGGFGQRPGAESHAGQIFTCTAALHITGELDEYLGEAGKDRLGAWLSERQLEDSGGLNGRPMKLVDVCYSWWVVSSLALIGRLHWIDRDKLAAFILRCQDPECGGFADRPEDAVDVFHTVFGVAGLSLLKYPGLEPVDAA